MLSSVTAMNEIYDLVACGLVTRAQERILEIELAPSSRSNPCPVRLPLSVLERVLRCAATQHALTRRYVAWCKNVYGPAMWARVSAELGIDPTA